MRKMLCRKIGSTVQYLFASFNIPAKETFDNFILVCFYIVHLGKLSFYSGLTFFKIFDKDKLLSTIDNIKKKKEKKKRTINPRDQIKRKFAQVDKKNKQV